MIYIRKNVDEAECEPAGRGRGARSADFFHVRAVMRHLFARYFEPPGRLIVLFFLFLFQRWRRLYITTSWSHILSKRKIFISSRNEKVGVYMVMERGGWNIY